MNRNPPLHEFIALVALLFSTAAFSIDAMLPSFPEISADLELANANHAQLVIVVFVLGISFGQLVMGPLSDSFGRKLIICTGLGMFLCACLWAYVADSLLSLLAARFVQGLGVAAPRTATQAMVRDRYSGREMAKVLSFAMMLFVLVPAVAPLIGQTIMLAFGWRFIFVSFQILALVAALWLIIRQPETHAPERRSAFRPRVILAALVEVLSNRRVLACTLSLSLGFACIFSYLMLAQQCYVDWLGAGEDFPLYFGLVALVSGSASFLNAMLVTRLGMWSLSTAGYCAIFLLSTVTALLIHVGRRFRFMASVDICCMEQLCFLPARPLPRKHERPCVGANGAHCRNGVCHYRVNLDSAVCVVCAPDRSVL